MSNKFQQLLTRLSQDRTEPITSVDLCGCSLEEFPRELFLLEDSLEFLNLGKIVLYILFRILQSYIMEFMIIYYI